MRNLIIVISCFSLLTILNCCKTGEKPSDRNTKVSTLDSVDLFNGRNLDGWYTFLKGRGRNNDPKNVFSVVNGMIRITGEEYGCLTTVNEFSDFKLEVEFKWGERTFAPRKDNARDNGILLHSVGTDGGFDSTWMHSIECQIIEGGTGDFIVVGDKSGRFSITANVDVQKQNDNFIYKENGEPVTINEGRINWFNRDQQWKDIKGFRGNNDIEHVPGEWNFLECVASKNTIRIFLNGILVNAALKVTPSKGRIQIQSEGAEIYFRKVKLYHLQPG